MYYLALLYLYYVVLLHMYYVALLRMYYVALLHMYDAALLYTYHIVLNAFSLVCYKKEKKVWFRSDVYKEEEEAAEQKYSFT